MPCQVYAPWVRLQGTDGGWHCDQQGDLVRSEGCVCVEGNGWGEEAWDTKGHGGQQEPSTGMVTETYSLLCSQPGAEGTLSRHNKSAFVIMDARHQ